jgi:pimeloyl-ACP methyl ester carboxylesterase
MNFNRLRQLPIRQFSRTIELIRGSATKNQSANNVTLRGIKLNSHYNDNPNMIFFVDYFDKPENWLTFFMNNGTLDQRNVYILNNPNFGNSDHTHPQDLEAIDKEEMALAVERFMWQNKISTATLAGHGFGARTAMLVGCNHSEIVTGIAAIDYTPMDYSKFDVTWKLQNAINSLSEITKDMREGKMTRANINNYIDKNIEHPKMQALFKQNVIFLGNNSFDWDFNMELCQSQFKEMITWKSDYGLYPGRAQFMFPEYSEYVFLGTHTNQMKKIAVSTHGYNLDIYSDMTETDETYSNHFIYEDSALSESFAIKLNRFLLNYDGVHTLLTNRNDVYERKFVPVRTNELKVKLSRDKFPEHYHHNWKYHNQ